jgi:hypothetical protein
VILVRIIRAISGLLRAYRGINVLKKYIVFIVLICCLIHPFSVFADVGPKPSLTITAKNMPDTDCYLDLLIDYPAENMYHNIQDKSKYNKYMFGLLETYNDNAWRPAMVTGTMPPMFGDIVCEVENGKCQLRFGYTGVPDKFKVIVVSSDGKIVVSNEIQRTAFNSTIKFDYLTGEASEASSLLSYIIQFIATCTATLIIEGIILLLFRFSIRANWKPFVIINIITQLMLTVLVVSIMFRSGTLIALFVYIPFEIIIFILEAMACKRFLKEHTTIRKVIYSITANIFSFVVGVIALFLPMM